MSVLKIVAAGIPLLALGACARSGAARGSIVAAGHAVVDDARGSEIGVATLTQDAGGIVYVAMKVHGVTPGMHGVHFHAVGSCVAPAFASAGGHFNPDSKHHGINNPAGPHAGDLPNMLVDASGNADYAASTHLVSLTSEHNGLFDADGSALVIHAAPDDNMSDPAGNAGTRIGCGVIRPALGDA